MCWCVKMAYANMNSADDMYSKRSLVYSLPITVGSFFRELLAVTLVLILQERAGTYDFFTQGFILLLIFLTFRIPYVNSYTLLFEAFSLGQWDVKNHVGMRKHADVSQNMFHVLVIFVAHVGGAIAAAALRVYFDVTYGTEVIFGRERLEGMRTDVAPSLQVNVDELRRIDSFWGGSNRLDRLEGVNGTIFQMMPLSGQNDLGIGSTALTVWYTTEEIGYVFMLCVCYIHIWLSSGVGENKKPPLNPFSSTYWQYLFKVCLLVVLVYMALYRAFPTAHGSMHTTIFKVQYQAWNPNVHLIDSDNSETFARIFGGLIGLFLAVGYNKILVGTERAGSDDDSGDFYYKLIWGLEPDPNHSKAKRTTDGWDSSDDEDPQTRRKGGRVHKWRYPRTGSRDDSAVGCKTYRMRHCDKAGNCTDASCTVCVGQNMGACKPDFKLRLPHTLDHAK